MKLVWDLPLDPAGVIVELDGDVRARIRPGRPGDGPALRGAFERFSEESRYFRFFTPTPRMSPQAEENLTAVDDHRQYAWGVFDPDQPSEVGDESGLAIAAARLFIDAEAPTIAEATLAVVDDYQGRGLGGLLMELLISTGAILELDILRFDVLVENRPMRSVLARLGASGRSLPDDRSIMRYDLPVPEGEVDPTIGALYLLLRAAAGVEATVIDPLND
ncbi:MAG: GNAT family N-acetyltransferase [Actinomycetota bacterium]